MRPELRMLVDRMLDLDQLEVDVFRGDSPLDATQRVFGGQVAGQALAAAARTAPPDRPVHSLHAYFLRPGDPAVPIVYTVDRVRDGRSFTTRRIIGVQHGKPIFTMSASFQTPVDDLDHQITMPEGIPGPETIEPVGPRDVSAQDGTISRWLWSEPLDLRPVPASPPTAAGVEPGRRLWVRTIDRLPDDAVLHAAVLTYIADMTLLLAVLAPHGRLHSFGEQSDFDVASIDHAMWFHRPFRADDWLMYDQDSPSASRGLGLATGRLWNQAGDLIASVAQEGYIRTRLV